jgi:hypothetical protein
MCECSAVHCYARPTTGECSCATFDESDIFGPEVAACPRSAGLICCLGNTCDCGMDSCSQGTKQVDSCSPSSQLACDDARSERVDSCDPATFKPSAGSNAQCWYPNWESDCGSSNDCDPGLTCTGGRCHGVACTGDQDCETTYGALEKQGRTYCASTCGNDGLCHF